MMSKVLRWSFYSLPPFIFIWLLVILVIWQAPVNWLLQQAQAGILHQFLTTEQQRYIDEIKWQALEGTLGTGQATNLETHLVGFDQLKWNVSFWRLALLWPAVNVTIGESKPWTVSASLQSNGDFYLTTQGGELEHLYGTSASKWRLAGLLEGAFSLRGRLDNAGFKCIDFNTDVNGVLQILQPMPLDLGVVEIKSNCLADQVINWKTQAKQANQYLFNAEGELTPSHWRLIANAEVKDGHNLHGLLHMLNWPQKPQIEPSELAPSKLYSTNKSGTFKGAHHLSALEKSISKSTL